MYDFLLRAISCVCIVHVGLGAEKCIQGVLARSETFYVPEGSTLSLSCVLQHCEGNWTDKWKWEHSSHSATYIIKESSRTHLVSVILTTNTTQLDLQILRVNKSDEGSYRCSVTWGAGRTEVGHWMHVNITKAASCQRNLFHRLLVCAGASLCLPVILGLARCLSSEVKPQPHPRIQAIYAAVNKNRPQPAPRPPLPLPRRPIPQKRTTPTHKAPPKRQQKTEVVYADISQEALRQQEAPTKPGQATVYSSLKFS
ncbi:uncharacterized protein PAE49_009561 [Odontesthes bonariensis]|uniref:uncharacterized protein LOC142388905 n=1 Tax=Odontesthes bonariensis TaxID=219752 RepID=UPI003F580D5F